MRVTTTLDLSWSEDRQRAQSAEPEPGVVAVLVAGQPVCAAAPLGADGTLDLGRGSAVGPISLDDGWMSRRHVRVRRRGEVWEVQDLGSRNGTALDGEVIEGGRRSSHPKVIRAGTSLFLLAADIRPFISAPTTVSGGIVMGPVLAEVFGQIARAGRFESSLHIVGESGVGKELAARAFHDLGPRAEGDFIAVNCAAIPEGVSERLLFGARKGAFSGADAHADGYVQAADKGTLFLDEVAELDLAVQAKLLRVIENREVLALGAARPAPVDLHICSASHKDLRREVTEQRLREDLYFRLARPEVRVPPLRERLEEIPLLIERALAEAHPGLSAHASLIEQCMLRHWPGNVRELISEVKAAARAALGAGVESVEARHLNADAGLPFPTRGAEAPARKRGDQPDQADIEAALARNEGNISKSARELGLHRTQLRRLLARYEIDPKASAE